MSEHLLASINTQMGQLLREVGGINARLDEGSRKHAEFSSSLKTLDERTDSIETDMKTVVKPMVEKVAGHDTILKKHGRILGRVAAVMGAASVVMFGAVNLVWWGLTNLWPTLIDLLRGKGVS